MSSLRERPRNAWGLLRRWFKGIWRRLVRIEEALAPFRALRYDPEATRSYELLSGGFVWSDEEPERLAGLWLLKRLIAHRTALIMGETDTPRYQETEAAWMLIREECPDWPGFRPERRDRSLKGELEARERELERAFERCERAERLRQARAARRRS